MDVYTWSMIKDDSDYTIMIVQTGEGRTGRHKEIAIKEKAAERWLHRLKCVHVSLLPEIDGSCDGSYYTFEFHNDGVGIELYWQNTPPNGAETLDKFVGWLWKLIPDEWAKESSETVRLIF